MPVTKSARKALRTSERRHQENLVQKYVYKKAIKVAKKALDAGSVEISDLFSKAQSALDRAAHANTIHPNKAARLKSRLNKKIVTAQSTPAEEKPKAKTVKSTKAKAATKKTTKKAA